MNRKFSSKVFLTFSCWLSTPLISTHVYLAYQLPYCFAYTSKRIHEIAFHRLKNNFYVEEHAPRPQEGALELSAVYTMQLVIYSMTCLEPCLHVLHMNSAGKQCVGGENEVHLLGMFALTHVRSTLHALNITYESSSVLNK